MEKSEAGQPSGEPNDQDGEVRVTIATIDPEVVNDFKSLEAALNQEARRSRSSSSNPNIQKAPSMFYDKKDFQKYIEPKVYSFGPIHYGKDKLMAGEKIKRRLATRFIEKYQLNKLSVYVKITENINVFKKCYDEEVVHKYTTKELIWMLFVDGCALLFYICCFVTGGLYNLRKENLPVDSALGDVFSMENQLPYGVLDLIMKSSASAKEIESFIDVFVKRNCMALGVKKTQNPEIANWRPNHLLDLLWKTMRYPAGEDPELPPHGKENVRWSPSYSLQQLKGVRIQLKSSASIQLRDIAFKKHFFSGELKMRSLILDDTTATKLSNLIAYEMCPDFKNDLEVTSYVCFLNSLVASTEDVADLRAAQVLLSFLPSDNDVFQLLREMASNLSPNPQIYYDTKWGIQNYLDSKRRTTVATWMFDAGQVYFKSPWTTIGILTATFLIIFSFLQTYFTIFPRKK